MAKQYKHLWVYKGKQFFQEGTPAACLESAIEDYKQEAGHFPYSDTFVWDSELGTCSSLDIVALIEEREAQEENYSREEYAELQSNIAYFAWAQNGRAY